MITTLSLLAWAALFWLLTFMVVSPPHGALDRYFTFFFGAFLVVVAVQPIDWWVNGSNAVRMMSTDVLLAAYVGMAGGAVLAVRKRRARGPLAEGSVRRPLPWGSTRSWLCWSRSSMGR